MIYNSPSANPGSAAEQATIIVVEDEVLVRLAITDALRGAGYNVLEAASADEAKVLLGAFPDIALVFTDVQMPGDMDGVALARHVRDNHPSLRIMLTSGLAQSALSTEEAMLFVAKPYDIEDMVGRVNALLDPNV